MSTEPSKLMEVISKQKNIKNTIRYDIPGDPLAPKVKPIDAIFNFSEHFHFTKNQLGQQDWLIQDIFKNGIR